MVLAAAHVAGVDRFLWAGGAHAIAALAYGVVGAQIVLTGAFRGSGNTLVAMAIALVSQWMLQFPLAWLLAERTGLGATGIWIAYPIQNVLTALIVVIWFARGTWKHRNVIEEPAPESAVSRYRPGSVTNTTLR